MLYAPGVEPSHVAEEPVEMQRTGTSAADYRRLILAADRRAFPRDLSARHRGPPPTTGRSSSTRRVLRNQFEVAFGRSMLFGNGLSALMTLMGISARSSALHPGSAVPERRTPGRRVGGLARLFRRTRRRLHAARSRAAPALRPAARASGVFADGDALLAAARHRAGQPDQPGDRPAPGEDGDVAGYRRRADRRGWSARCCCRQIIEIAIPWPLPLRAAVAAAVLLPTRRAARDAAAGRDAPARRAARRTSSHGAGASTARFR